MSIIPSCEYMSELCNKYRQMMYRTAFKIVKNRSDAEDVVQDAFMWVIEHYEKVKDMSDEEIPPYFTVMVQHIAYNKIKSQKRHPSESIDEHYDIPDKSNTERQTDENDLKNIVLQAIRELPLDDYSMLRLYLFEQRTPKEIAEKMDIPEDSIRVYIQRAREKLKKLLNERGINDEF